MGRNKRDTNNNEYRFINETIKKKTLDKKRIFRKLISIIGSDILFGCCASAACVGMFPFLSNSSEFLPPMSRI